MSPADFDDGDELFYVGEDVESFISLLKLGCEMDGAGRLDEFERLVREMSAEPEPPRRTEPHGKLRFPRTALSWLGSVQ